MSDTDITGLAENTLETENSTEATNGNGVEEPTESSLPFQMKKGLFGKSASNIHNSSQSTVNDSFNSVKDSSLLQEQDIDLPASADVSNGDESGDQQPSTSPIDNVEVAVDLNVSKGKESIIENTANNEEEEEEEEDMPPTTNNQGEGDVANVAETPKTDVTSESNQTVTAEESVSVEVDGDEKSNLPEAVSSSPKPTDTVVEMAQSEEANVEEKLEESMNQEKDSSTHTAVTIDSEPAAEEASSPIEKEAHQPETLELVDDSEEKKDEGAAEITETRESLVIISQVTEFVVEEADNEEEEEEEEEEMEKEDEKEKDQEKEEKEKEPQTTQQAVEELPASPRNSPEEAEAECEMAVDESNENEEKEEETEEKKEEEKEKKEAEKKEEKEEKEKDDEEEMEMEEPVTPARRRGRLSRGSQPQKTPQSSKKTAKTPSSADKNDVSVPDEDSATEMEETKTPLRSSRRAQKKETGDTKLTPVAAKKQKKVKEEREDEEKGEEEEEEAPTPRVLRGRKSTTTKKDESPKKTPMTSSRKRGQRLKKEEEEGETEEKEEEEVSTPLAAMKTPKLTRGRGSLKTPSSSSVKAPAPVKSASFPSSSREKEGERDPFDFDTEKESHPEPLNNIKMEMQSFGEVKYARVGTPKYECTEKTAESRVGNLSDLAPPKAKERRSLAELTPGRKKATPKGVKSAPPARKGRGRKASTAEADDEGDEEEAMDAEEMTTPKEATPARKRKATGTPAASSAKRNQMCVEYPLPQLDAEALWAVDHPSDEHVPLEKGARIYAAFGRVYYPAVVVGDGKDSLGRYKVHFLEDNVVKDAPSSAVIPLRAVVADESCYVTLENEEVVEMMVVRSPDAASAEKWAEAVFRVAGVDEEEEGKGEMDVKWDKLSLDMTDWKGYIDKKAKELTSVNSDNISEEKSRESRRSRAVPQTPSISGQKQTPKQKKTPKSASSAAKKTPKATPRKRRPRQSCRMSTGGGLTREEREILLRQQQEEASRRRDDASPAAVPVAVASPRGGGPPTLEKKPEKTEVYEGSDTDDDGSLPPIFAEKMFILTSAQRAQANGAPSVFRKKMMSDFITQCMGLVVEDFSEVDKHPNRTPFLISDTHYRTHKYLSAMARGVPCVSHEWIHNCRESATLLSYEDYLLPAGICILDQKAYPLPTRQATLLTGKTVFVHTNNYPTGPKALNFVQIWEPMVSLLGGRAITEMPEEGGEVSVDIMLTDPSASPELLEAARARNAHVVSSEWLIQGIIMNELPPVDAHPRFKHNGGSR